MFEIELFLQNLTFKIIKAGKYLPLEKVVYMDEEKWDM